MKDVMMTGTDVKYVAEISPPAQPGLVVLERVPGCEGDIEMGPLLLTASFTGLQGDSQHYRVEIYTVVEGRKVAGVRRDIEMPPRPGLYPNLNL